MQKIKGFFLEIYYFFSSKIFLKNIVLMGVSFVVIIFALFFFLKWYTLHGESIEVPDVTRMTVADAKTYLKTRGLRCVIADSVYKADKTPGLILEQTPRAGSQVKESRKIYLTVNMHTPPMVNLYYKEVIGRPLKYIERKFESLDLKIGPKPKYIRGKGENTVARASIGKRLLFREADPSKGEVPSKEPQRVPRGTVIDLVVYEGIDKAPKHIPKVFCQTYGDAELIIKSHQFNVGHVNITGNITDTLSAYVWKQSPIVGSVASLGTGIDLWLTNEKPENCNNGEWDDTGGDSGSSGDATKRDDDDGFD